MGGKSTLKLSVLSQVLLSIFLAKQCTRLPVLFWSQVLTLICIIIVTTAPNYACFTAFRTLQGFVNTAPQVIGLSIIHDMFFLHERARKINLWVFSFIIGPFLGPLISSLLLSKIGWHGSFAVLTGLHGLSVVLVILLGDETLYCTSEDAIPAERINRLTSKGLLARIELLTGVTGATAGTRHRPELWASTKRLFSLLKLPYLVLPCKLRSLSIL
jgi:MFS family permease